MQLPAGWDGRRGLGLRLSVRSTPTDTAVVRGGLGREELAAFRWSLAVGDELLDEEEIAELVAAKAPLVRLRGQWVSVDAERLRRGLEFLRSARARRAPPTAARCSRCCSTTWPAATVPLPVTSVEAEGWLGDLLSGAAERTLRPVDPPAGFAAELRPYQQRGLSWLAFLPRSASAPAWPTTWGWARRSSCSRWRPHERHRRADARPTLLVCPMSLVGNWQREAARFAPDLRVHVHHGADAAARRRAAPSGARHADLVVTTYAPPPATRRAGPASTWRRLVLDEAQTVKNAAPGRPRRSGGSGAEHRVALTGTPVENRLAELWSIMDFLNPGLLGTAERFRSRFAIPVERHGNAERRRAAARAHPALLLRRLKTDPTIIDDLPDKIEMKQYCPLTREQATLYQPVVDDMLEKIEGADGIARRGNVLAALTKLKQVCNHPAQFLHDGSPVGRRVGQADPAGGDARRGPRRGRPGAVLHPVRRVGRTCWSRTCPRGSARRCCSCTAARRKRRRDAMVRAVPGGRRARRVPAVAEGRRHRAEPHRGQPRLPLRPVVEPGGRGPGDRPRLPDRAAAQRAGAQVRLRRHAGGADRRDDRAKKALAEHGLGDGEGWLTELSTETLREVFALGAEAEGDE